MSVHIDKQMQHDTRNGLQRASSDIGENYFVVDTARTGRKGKENPVPCYTLKIRGADTYIMNDGKIGTAGKGPLIQRNISATLGTSQDQYLFVLKRKPHETANIAKRHKKSLP